MMGWMRGAAATAVMAGALAAAPVASAQEEVTFALPSVGMLYLPVYAADVMGYFEEEGIAADIRVFKSGGGAAMASVISGDTHVYPGTPAAAMRAVEQGTDVRIFAALMTQYASNVVIRGEVAQEKGITEDASLEERLAALEGLNIGVTGAGSGTHQLALYLVQQAGLDPDTDATIVFVGGSREILASFELGRIDAFILSNPTSDTAIEEHGGMLLFDMAAGAIPELDGYLYITLNARKSWLDEDPERTTGLVRAIHQAQQAMHDPERTEAVRDAVYEGYFDQFERDLFNAAWTRVVPAYPTSPELSVDKLERVIEFLNEFSDRGFDPSLAQEAMTNEYVERAMTN
ncbi:ABC transporter substrate-binding protein [Acuticoccus sp.]|uniref:ABC transporter substrate-binding protein n=1 Tax=Acuticoccus sp. TaxID=1904378 RepID=UPI003B522538